MRILFATDLTESPDVAAFVEQTARQMGATLFVLHVFDPLPAEALLPLDPLTGMGDFGAYALYDPADPDRAQREEAHAFEAFLRSHFTRPVQASMREGSPAETILADAREHGIDLIALTNRHHSRLERLLSGSVCRRVVDQAQIPLLLIPELDD